MDEAFKPIAPAARILWGVSGIAIIAVFSSSFLIASFYLSRASSLLVVLFFVAASIWWWWISGRRWRAWGYAERERDLVIRRGVIVRRVTIIPYGRMQFVDTKQGPLDRLLGVSTVVLTTAAAATDATIPMLDNNEAERLRDRLTSLGESHATGL